MKAAIKPFVGTWRIVEMETWDQDFVNMPAPGQITFKRDSTGSFRFGMVEAETDCRVESEEGATWVEFTWAGSDECEPVNGRGWAMIADNELHGHLFFHQGEDSSFRAVKSKKNKK